MPLYKTSSNPAVLAQSAMNSATQAAASQTKQTTTKVKKESNFWDDLYKGAAALNMGARAVSGIVDTAEGVWDMYDKYKLRDAYDSIDKAFAEGGFEAIQNNPDMQDYWHSQALGQFVKDRANNEKGRLEMLNNMDAVSDKKYQDWRLHAMSAREAFDSGDMQQFMPLMRQLAADSPVPYRLEPDNSGNFKVLFRSDQHGGWVDTGRTMTPREAMDEVNNVLRGEQMILRGVDMKLSPANAAFTNAARKAYWGTVMGNAENRLDPKKQIPLYDASGKMSGIGVIQNPVDDYNAGPKLVVFGRNGSQIGMFDGYDEAMRAGLSPFRPENKGRGDTKVGPGGTPHIAMLNAGYVWDKNQKWYFKAGVDADGKPQADFSQPADMELYRAIVGRYGGVAQGIDGTGVTHGTSKGDPAGILGQRRQATPQGVQRPAPPNIPRRENTPSQRPNTGQLILYSKNGTSQWGIIGEDGRPQDITPDEAKAYSRQLTDQKPTTRRPVRVTVNDVWNELSPEEQVSWQKTGKLPDRYSQVR